MPGTGPRALPKPAHSVGPAIPPSSSLSSLHCAQGEPTPDLGETRQLSQEPGKPGTGLGRGGRNLGGAGRGPRPGSQNPEGLRPALAPKPQGIWEQEAFCGWQGLVQVTGAAQLKTRFLPHDSSQKAALQNREDGRAGRVPAAAGPPVVGAHAVRPPSTGDMLGREGGGGGLLLPAPGRVTRKEGQVSAQAVPSLRTQRPSVLHCPHF